MKRLLSVILLSVGMLVLGTSVQANLIADPDFTGVTLQPQNFVVNDAATYNKWYTSGVTGPPLVTRWVVVNNTSGPDGPALSDYWAQHLNEAVPIFQGINGPSPGLYEVSLDYIYQDTIGVEASTFAIVGLNAGQSFSFFDIVPPPDQGTTLYTAQLVPPLATNWTTFPTATFNVSQQYAAWVFVVWDNSWSSTGQASGLRGIDNINLAPVPEPTTMLLLGSGLLGLWGARRKFKK